MTAPVRPAEAGHWYWPDGSPAYTIVGANGKERPTDLRDARKLGLLPSVTTIIRAAANPGLEAWKQRQVMLAALTLPRNADEDEAAFVERILADSKEEASRAADRGTQIHAAVQAAYEGQPVPEEHRATVDVVRSVIREHFGEEPHEVERSFAHPAGFGGKVDLHGPSYVVDVKTKAFTAGDKVAAYDEHRMQLAAYRVGLDHPTARLANVFVSTLEPGLVRVVEHTEAQAAQGWAMFWALLQYWQARTGHTVAA